MDCRRWMAALAAGWLLTGGMAAQEKNSASKDAAALRAKCVILFIVLVIMIMV